jgi:ATP-binding cassette subfamily E protein 1
MYYVFAWMFPYHIHTYRVIVYDGNPGVETTAHKPQMLIAGMNKFLKALDISFRRDPSNFRPRINKMDSVKDKEQKTAGNYFFMEGKDD